MLLFIAHSKFTQQEIKCRFYGPCAVTSAVLNGVTLAPLTEVKVSLCVVMSCVRPRFFLFVELHYTFRNFKVQRLGKNN